LPGPNQRRNRGLCSFRHADEAGWSAKAGLAQFPLVVGGVVPVVRLPGIESGQMHFTGQLLADIFLGKIKNWADPEILKLNPGLNLPERAIIVVHRTDGSGTTFNWVNYLWK
jgi:phosphate transport system substrate-binding protein